MAQKRPILITGGAGFIGSACAKALMDKKERVVLVDNFNDYYDPKLKNDRIKKLLKGYRFTLYRADIRDKKKIEKIFAKEKPKKVIHLAAMAGVRFSIEHPDLYADVNIMGSINILEECVKNKVENLVFASSSSVYGNTTNIPFSESAPVDTPLSPYAATKKADELLAHVYSHLHKLPIVAMRFFTVYGPWGRPDMALFKFADRIVKGEKIDVYNHGKMKRNFTYIDDIVSGVLTVLDRKTTYDVVNIGGDREETLLHFIEVIEKSFDKKAKKRMMAMQPGDVPATVADISKLRKMGWEPKTRIEEGVKNFVNWYREYYKV
ncbi:MAG: SDR family NAD(P)-dependent oxidoreductase [Candidatus Moranbacteria bacterium]|nr:SDR family NAD(P)-dependent oxidoreductase [Candidatus Moranbacteria bacterium]